MGRSPGVQLDEALKAQFAGLELHQQRISRSFSTTRELLSQLMPVLERISSRAIHRDIKPSNVLVEGLGSFAPHFSLIDFGLAVSTTQYQRGGWRDADVAGDCRYWPVSSWIAFELGPQALSIHPRLLHEYTTQVDVHALGLTALQVLVESLPSESALDSLQDGVSRALQSLRAAWRQYWEGVTELWRGVLEAFQRGSQRDMENVKAAYTSRGAHKVVGEYLRALRRAIAAMHVALDSAQATDSACICIGGVAATLTLLNTLHKMVSAGETETGKASWGELCSLLDNAVGAPENVPATLVGKYSAWPTPSTASSAGSGPSSVASSVVATSTQGSVAWSPAEIATTGRSWGVTPWWSLATDDASPKSPERASVREARPVENCQRLQRRVRCACG